MADALGWAFVWMPWILLAYNVGRDNAERRLLAHLPQPHTIASTQPPTAAELNASI